MNEPTLAPSQSRLQPAKPKPSAWDAIADPLVLVACGFMIGVTLCGMIRQYLQSSVFETMLERKVEELERLRATG